MFVGIISAGTYYSPWTRYTLASMYPVVDKIVVVNGGYNLKDPKVDEYNIPLEQVHDDISDLDFKEKVYEITQFSINDLQHKYMFTTQKHANDEGMKVNWYDIRGLNITLANEIACKLGATMILKCDSDQVLFDDCIGLRNAGSVTCSQWEYDSDIYHLADPGPSTPYNDSVFTYAAYLSDYYGGGGGPHVTGERTWSDKYHCAHLRSANPDDASEEEKFQHFFGRVAFRLYTNDYGVWNSDLLERAGREARSMVDRKPTKPSTVYPEICRIPRKDLSEYLVERYS